MSLALTTTHENTAIFGGVCEGFLRHLSTPCGTRHHYFATTMTPLLAASRAVQARNACGEARRFFS
jgi:hypothetical protein